VFCFGICINKLDIFELTGLIIIKRSIFEVKLAIGGSTVVVHSTTDPEMLGLNPAVTWHQKSVTP
jgi:hypothetical protein